MKKTISFLLILLSVSSHAFNDVDKPLKTSILQRKIVEEIAKLKVDLDIPLLGGEVIDGINISTNYSYEMYPSFMDNMYTRVDGWEFDVNVSPGDIVQSEMSTPFGFSIYRGSKVYFIRHFEKQKDALLARPYGLGKIPLSAKILKDKLQPGDMVSMPAELTLSLGASVSEIGGVESLFSTSSARVGVYLTGKFIVQVMKMKDNKARMRLITDASRGASLGLSHRIGASFFGIEFIDNKINQVHPLALVEAGISGSRGKQFIIDYVFDLNSNIAARAYNNIINSRKRFKDITAARAMLERGQIAGEKIASTELADKVFSEDRELLRRGVSDSYRVQRLFKGSNIYRRTEGNIKLNLIFIEHEGRSSFTKNNIVRINGSGEESEFSYQIKRNFSERSRGLGYNGFVQRQEKTMFSLLKKEDFDSTEEFPDIGISVTKRERVFRKSEQGSFYRQLGKVLPRGVFSRLGWDRPEEKQINAAANYKLIIKGELFKKIPRLASGNRQNKHRLFQNYLDYLEDLKRRNIIFTNEVDIPVTYGDVSFFHKLYNVIYNDEWTAEKKQRKLMTLRNNKEFCDFGIGFILYLVSYSDMVPNISFEFSHEADNFEKLELDEGDQSINGLYNQIYSIQNSLQDRGYDLRLAQ
jgi:hypothetical protein